MSYEPNLYSIPMTRYLLVEFIRNYKRDYVHRKDNTNEIYCYFCKTYKAENGLVNNGFHLKVLSQYNGEQIYCKMCYNLYTRLKSERGRRINIHEKSNL